MAPARALGLVVAGALFLLGLFHLSRSGDGDAADQLESDVTAEQGRPPADAVAQLAGERAGEAPRLAPTPEQLRFVPVPRPKECPRSLPHPYSAKLPLRFPPPANGTTLAPNIVHFVFGYKGDNPPFSFLNYVAVVSALAVQRPEKVMIHCGKEPAGFFWDLVRPHITVVRGRPVDGIFGNKITNYAHKADIVRLEALLVYGGIYLDVDVVTLRPFDDIMHMEAAMGYEGEGGRVGLCNAVIVSVPNGCFLREWYDSYRNFSSASWNYHSVQLPKRLAEQLRGSIESLDYRTFHWPLWDDSGMALMLDSYAYDYKRNKAVHMWNHGIMRSKYKHFGMPWCFECHSTLVSMLKAYVPDPLISVVIHCDAPLSSLQATLWSVANQAFPAWEVVLVDSSAPGGCGEGVLRWINADGMGDSQDTKSRVRLVVSAGRARSEARNDGIQAASAPWVMPLSYQEGLDPLHFKSAAHHMSMQPSVSVISPGHTRYAGGPKVETDTFGRTMTTHRSVPPATMYLKKIWSEVGGYSRVMLPWGAEEWDFWHKVLLHGSGGAHENLADVVLNSSRAAPARDLTADSEAVRNDREALAVLCTRHRGLYHATQMLACHKRIMRLSYPSRLALEGLKGLTDLAETERSHIKFWLALADLFTGRAEQAAATLHALQGESALQWQAQLYHALALCELHGAGASAAMLTSIERGYPELRNVIPFRQHLVNCRDHASSAPSPARRDFERTTATAAKAT